MIAVETNIVVRFLTEDYEKQFAMVLHLFDTEIIWLSKTVLLETEWVLRSRYRLSPAHIIDGFQRLIGLPQVELEDTDIMLSAINWCHSHKMDFAAALHLAVLPEGTVFTTFDQRLQKLAPKLKRPIKAPATLLK